MARVIRVAAWQYPIERVASWDAWRAKLAGGIAEAASRGAALCVVPEYASMELTALLPEPAQATLAAQLDALQPLLPGYLEAYAELARRHRIAIVGGSFPERVASGEVRNRARVHGPAGDRGRRGEAADDPVRARALGRRAGRRADRDRTRAAGRAVRRREARRGALLRRRVPAPREEAGRRRRRRRSRCRAAPTPRPATTGSGSPARRARSRTSATWSRPRPSAARPGRSRSTRTSGAAGVFAPPDRGLPDDGVVALGPRDEPGWVVADLDLDAIDAVRRDGQVLGHRDWDRAGHTAGSAATARLEAPR